MASIAAFILTQGLSLETLCELYVISQEDNKLLTYIVFTQYQQ